MTRRGKLHAQRETQWLGAKEPLSNDFDMEAGTKDRIEKLKEKLNLRVDSLEAIKNLGPRMSRVVLPICQEAHLLIWFACTSRKYIRHR